ncbi:hypothetical protein SK128_026309 [Halocaridina rubra]|uniref:Uncharacterized protein n=1 Tax=Halocaridina rubra TaxID=373956 RepID=A0AAN8WN67_HALRR
MLTSLPGGYYTSPTHPSPPPSASPMFSSNGGIVSSGEGHSPSSPRSHPQVQYCDTCNTACVFMNGKRRKFQARYEGYVLVKKVSTRPFLPYVMPEGQQQTLLQQQQQSAPHLPSNMRRHSCGDMLDENEDPATVPLNVPSCSASVPALGGEGGEGLNSSASYNRSLSHPGWQPDDASSFTPPTSFPPSASWEQVPCSHDGLGGNPVERHCTTPVQHSSPLTTHPPPAAPPRSGEIHPGGRKPRRHSAMMERLSGGHQRLCRKKSRSQDNLVGGRRDSGCGPLRLNNSIIPPTASLTSALSRSEGSIHNVHAVLTAVPICVDDVDVVGFGGLRAEVGELARLPKKLLHRVTGEVGQLVFDLEGWREEYLLLTNTAIAARTYLLIS